MADERSGLPKMRKAGSPKGIWEIADSGVAVTRAAPRRWQLIGRHDDAMHWLMAHGLWTKHFPRRVDAVMTVSALMASQPVTATARRVRPVQLIRDAPGRYRCPDGLHVIERDLEGSDPRGWIIRRRQPSGQLQSMAWCPTLHRVKETLSWHADAPAGR